MSTMVSESVSVRRGRALVWRSKTAVSRESCPLRPSGIFLASKGTSNTCPFHSGCFVPVCVVPNSGFWRVVLETERVVEPALGGVYFGEHPAGSGAASRCSAIQG